MNVRDFKALHRNTLRGFFTLELDSGLVIKDCSVHVRDDGRKWFAFPAKPQLDKDGKALRDGSGKVLYANIIAIDDRRRSDKLQQLVLEALAPFLEEATEAAR